jgi:hypothetical protein
MEPGLFCLKFGWRCSRNRDYCCLAFEKPKERFPLDCEGVAYAGVTLIPQVNQALFDTRRGIGK